MTPDERKKSLELEFERLKEHADHLDRFLQGHPDVWLGIVERMPPTVAEVVIDKAVAEARQTSLAMASIHKTLMQLSDPNEKPTEVDPLADQLAQRRARTA